MTQYIDFRHAVVDTGRTFREKIEKRSWLGRVKSVTEGRLFHVFECRKCKENRCFSYEHDTSSGWDFDYVKDEKSGIEKTLIWLPNKCSVGEFKEEA